MAYSVIKKPSDYFNTKLYTGTGATHNITGVGFQPDWTWLKNRDTANDHELFDAVRGATKTIYPNRTDAEYTNASGSLTSFNSDGFTVGSGDGANKSGSGIASWNWKANGAGVANTDGSISSTVSANTTSGFSIVQYTGNGTSGATFGHGLGVMPSHIIIKRTSSAEAWVNWHSTFSALQYLRLYQATVIESSINLFNNTLPTSSVVSLGTGGFTNTSGETYIAYCFAEKQGFSKFGSYNGNSNADGTFVYTGFKPAFVMVKMINGADDWQILDNKRSPHNIVGGYLLPNSSSATINNDVIDFTSNGFKLRTTAGSWNHSSYQYLYMCFAEEPLVGDNPATAR